MNTRSIRSGVAWLALLIVATIFTRSAEAEIKPAIPDHASVIRFGNGWQCNDGFREHDGQCVKIDVPANAHLSGGGYGTGWQCDWAFTEEQGNCISINVPAHAYLSFTGTRWHCDRGYRRVNNVCEAVEVPPSA